MSKALIVPKFKTPLKGTKFYKIRGYCGFGTMDKFLKKVAAWNTLKHPVPINYIDAICIDLKVLEFCLEIDKELYLHKLNNPRYPKYATARSGIYVVTYELPNVREAEVISFVREVIATESKTPFFIEYRDFLTIKIVSGEALVYHYRIPGLVRKGNFYCFTDIKIRT
jgi:hypothetical protein